MFTNLYLKLAVLGVIVSLLGAENIYVYERGKQSVFQGVIAGTETYQKQQVVKAKADVAQAEADTKTITSLTQERNALRKKLAYVPPAVIAPDCSLSDDQLLSIQQAVGSGTLK